MSGYPPPGPPYYGGGPPHHLHLPPHPHLPPPHPHQPPPHPHLPPPPPHQQPSPFPHLPPGSFTYLPTSYSYQRPPPHWQHHSYISPYSPQPIPPTSQPQIQPPIRQPYVQPPSSQPYVQPPSSQPYVQPPSNQPYVQPPSSQPYVRPSTPPLQPTTPTQTSKPPSYGVLIVEEPTTSVAEPEKKPASTPTEDDISWVPATPTTAEILEYKAVVGGREGYDWSPLWIIRAHHKGELIPGKLAIKHRYAFIPSVGKEVPVHNFEILCSKPGAVQWIPSRDGQVPEKAIVAGNTINAEPLYIGRVSHKWSVTPGKVDPAQGCCYISYGGSEISFKKYEVLCQAG